MVAHSIVDFIHVLLQDKRFHYLIVGGVNTCFGYGIAILLYSLLHLFTHTIIICILSSIAGITFSFATYKYFVFQTRGNWIKEYFRCYIVYGGSSALSILVMWFLVDGLTIPFWVAQLCTMGIVFISSYIGHKKYTFSS